MKYKISAWIVGIIALGWLATSFSMGNDPEYTGAQSYFRVMGFGAVCVTGYLIYKSKTYKKDEEENFKKENEEENFKKENKEENFKKENKELILKIQELESEVKILKNENFNLTKQNKALEESNQKWLEQSATLYKKYNDLLMSKISDIK